MDSIKITRDNVSGTDLTGYEGYAVKNTGTGLAIATAVDSDIIGIITKGGATESDVCIFGECYAKAQATVTKDKAVMSHTDGLVKNDSNTAARVRVGRALEAGTVGAYFRMFVNPQYIAINVL
jgi:hypothetical protein